MPSAAPPFLPAPSLPKGGGAIRGMGETLTVNPARGTASLRIPLPLSPGRGDVTPELALGYDSGAGNSPFGLGFRLDLPSISRRTDHGVPRYDDDDTFVLTGVDELVPALVKTPDSSVAQNGSWQLDRFNTDIDGFPYIVSRYRPRVEAAFSRIERCDPAGGGPPFWRVTSRDNVTSIFGRGPTARVADPADPSRVFEWLIQEVRDDRGNVAVFTYKPEDHSGVDGSATHEAHRLTGPLPAARYLKYVRYANRVPGDPATCTLTVAVDYGEHDARNPTPEATTAWPVRADAFSTYRAGFEVRTWRLARRILMFHDFPELGDGPLPRLVRSVDLAHDENPTVTTLVSVVHTGYTWAGDEYQRRSLPPVELSYTGAGPDSALRRLNTIDGAPLPGEPDVAGAYWVDLDGEGLPGALTRHAGGWWYQRNLGGARLGARRPVRSPSVGTDGELRLADIDGGGRIALVEWGPDRFGFVERDPSAEHGWGPYTPFPNVPTLELTDPTLRHVDLDGDGLPDLLFADGETLRWHENLGREGYGPSRRVWQGTDEARAPLLVVTEPARSVYLADMTGDGLTDLVRIRNGEVCYWPNLGHGRFGPMVVMSDPPVFDHPEQFDAGRLRLGDVDGTGPADLVYLSRDGVRYWGNRAGNGYGPAEELTPFPDCDDLSSVELTDLLGTGTACLVWSSPSTRDDADRVRYLDLSHGGDPTLAPDDERLAGMKPHLLAGVVNNLGAERRIRYSPSTRHYLAAAESGEPWLTRMPFPVQVVDLIEVADLVSATRLTSRYRYWHGYFDSTEREFRGFALVETVDADSVPGPPGPPLDHQLDLPPVRSRSWFHLGAYPDLTGDIAAGSWSGDDLAAPLPAGEIVGAESGRETQEGYRALAGSPLRTEVYADDDTATAAVPYAVTAYRHRATRLQPGEGGRPAVFLGHQLETVTQHYERDPADPRVSHQLTLDIDEYGSIRRSAAIGYRRRQPDIPEQGQTLVTLTVTDVVHTSTGAVHRLGSPVRSQVYQVTGLPDPGAGRYSYGTVHAALTGPMAEISYQHAAAPGLLQRRLIESTLTRYWTDDLGAELPTGVVGSRALVRQSLRLTFTTGLLHEVFGERVTPDLLTTEGGYQFDEGAWWIPSGVRIYDSTAFFLPVGFRDPFGTTSSVRYDAHHLLVTQVNAAHLPPYDMLKSIVDNDYRTLSPRRITDPNGNQSWVAFDPIGAVVAAGRAGKTGGRDGDPEDLPGAVYSYDLDEWLVHRRPVWAEIRNRERHGDPSSPWQQQRTYSDGFGRAVMTKEQAEPGLAWAMDAVGQPVQVDTTPQVRWVGTGRTVFNNKGLPVARYEPYFSATLAFEDDDALVKQGVTAYLRYDPLGRVVHMDFPDGTLGRAEFDPWRQAAWDANDTVLDSFWYAQRGSPDPAGEPEPADPDRRAAWLAARHAATPTVSVLDSLGRTVRTLTDNGANGRYQTTVVLDIEGNIRSVIDPRGLTVASHVTDIAGRVIHTTGPDAGSRWLLPDALGAPVRRWDTRGAVVLYRYDALHRPSHIWIHRGPAQARELAVLTVYGEAHPEALSRNLRGQAWRRYDGAGVATTERMDFKGNPLVESCRLATAVQPAPDWSALADQPIEALDTAAALLGDETFTTTVEYDALDRPVAQTLPDGTVVLPRYNQAGLLDGLSARLRAAETPTAFVANIDYNAKGQRELIEYPKAMRTRYSYDPLSYRMLGLQTHRGPQLAQDLSYTYDPVGNVVEISDGAQQTLFFAGQVVAPTARYGYDAVYRLVQASGREHASITGQLDHIEPTIRPVPHPNDGQATRRYTESYDYDEAGNIRRMAHSAGTAGSWTRRYDYPANSNRLLGHSQPGDPDGTYSAQFGHDPHGCMSAMPHLPAIGWDVSDLMATVDLAGGGRAEYGYDAAGRRRRKIVVRSGGLTEERIYLGALELFRRWQDGALVFERQTVHITDDVGRVALVETVTVDSSTGAVTGIARTRFQFTNHLGSSVMELDEDGATISYEEYHPYGTTSLWLAAGAGEVSVKRYRYTGTERDDETSLGHHGIRQYAPWLGRWTSPDPAGFVDGTNRYAYARGDPAVLVDRAGQQSKEPEQLWLSQAPPYRAEVTATAKGRGISQRLRQLLQKVGAMWGQGLEIDVGHKDKPFFRQRAGETSEVWAESARENRKRGATEERRLADEARAKGEFARVKGVDPDATPGVRYGQPDLPPALESPAVRDFDPAKAYRKPSSTAASAPAAPAPTVPARPHTQLELPFGKPAAKPVPPAPPAPPPPPAAPEPPPPPGPAVPAAPAAPAKPPTVRGFARLAAVAKGAPVLEIGGKAASAFAVGEMAIRFVVKGPKGPSEAVEEMMAVPFVTTATQVGVAVEVTKALGEEVQSGWNWLRSTF